MLKVVGATMLALGLSVGTGFCGGKSKEKPAAEHGAPKDCSKLTGVKKKVCDNENKQHDAKKPKASGGLSKEHRAEIAKHSAKTTDEGGKAMDKMVHNRDAKTAG